MSIVLSDRYLNEIFGGEFELIHSGHCGGQYNMDFDYNRAIEVAEGKVLPMLRFYGWNPWTLSLGYNQSEESINKEECEKRGFGLVRRPTGGRAVLHAEELTYSVAVNVGSNRSANDLYREIHRFLLGGLKKLTQSTEIADELDFEKSQPDFKDFYRQSGYSVSCFASSARYEIAYKNRKIVGSAQRLFGDTLLQHGSILLGNAHEQLAYIAKVDTEEKKAALLKYIQNHSISLSEICGREIGYNESLSAILNNLGITNINF